MAKKSLLDSTAAALAGAALNESAGEVKKTSKKVTQKEGSIQVSLKKFPIEWHEQIKDYTPGAVSDYILLAVKAQMVRDGLI